MSVFFGYGGACHNQSKPHFPLLFIMLPVCYPMMFIMLPVYHRSATMYPRNKAFPYKSRTEDLYLHLRVCGECLMEENKRTNLLENVLALNSLLYWGTAETESAGSMSSSFCFDRQFWADTFENCSLISSHLSRFIQVYGVELTMYTAHKLTNTNKHNCRLGAMVPALSSLRFQTLYLISRKQPKKPRRL